MNRQAILNFREAMFNEVAHAATVMIETRSVTLELGRAVSFFTMAHQCACRELSVGRPAARVQRLVEAIQIARIHLEQANEGCKRFGPSLDEPLAILLNALAEEEGNG